MVEGNIYLDNFTVDNVDLRVQDNAIWRVNYRNSMIDRQRVEEDVPEPFKSVIFMMWGDNPTIVEEYI